MDKISFLSEDGENIEFYVLEQTTVGGVNYILVTDSEEEDGKALILKDLSNPSDEEANYEIVSDEEELSSVGKIFEQLLEGVELQ
ncbi:MAG: DUF1292 domain-containing protein [Lachnospiraceae bacterium]|nr:DUF1292 domain-containing protein [Lachnospiraceae bacterium]